jgi:hypothetical protein
MNEQFFAQIVAELRDAQGMALGLLTQAICQQIDPAKLKDDLQKGISAAKLLHTTSPVAIQIATYAMAAAEAESGLQVKRQDAEHRPNS